MSETLHFSCVAIGGRGVLIGGASGAGKSDLALRLIDRGAMLVSDDYTTLTACDGTLIASAPPNIAGRIEVRGIGIVSLPYLAEAPAALLVTLDDVPERLPMPAVRPIAGLDIREVAVDARSASAPIKVELALAGLVEEP
ncbi:MAG: HPr kinase/phosphatase C-terminal domain-containing protein [Sphingomonas sp.]|uniref:HPr kinase/phosphorylase n=1 Tax=Sphingomonas sp. TaxID=28214 RepID=UPI001AC2A25F|nr:HPr kinase/phosphatase C-terminal domain-containing protein [Sphingomonas sp.]MBN8807476.1 HPr kinase/phosphatase C-terminal domain-containing protein [Sphingomonas sp.]